MERLPDEMSGKAAVSDLISPGLAFVSENLFLGLHGSGGCILNTKSASGVMRGEAFDRSFCSIIFRQIKVVFRRRFLVTIVPVGVGTVVHEIPMAFLRDQLSAGNSSSGFPRVKESLHILDSLFRVAASSAIIGIVDEGKAKVAEFTLRNGWCHKCTMPFLSHHLEDGRTDTCPRGRPVAISLTDTMARVVITALKGGFGITECCSNSKP
jgi:hypothetical protein